MATTTTKKAKLTAVEKRKQLAKRFENTIKTIRPQLYEYLSQRKNKVNAVVLSPSGEYHIHYNPKIDRAPYDPQDMNEICELTGALIKDVLNCEQFSYYNTKKFDGVLTHFFVYARIEMSKCSGRNVTTFCSTTFEGIDYVYMNLNVMEISKHLGIEPIKVSERFHFPLTNKNIVDRNGYGELRTLDSMRILKAFK